MATTLRTAISSVALLVAGLGSVATTPDQDEYWRYPCDHEEGWDPSAPIYLHFAYEYDVDPDIPGLLDGIRLMDPEGTMVQLVLASHEGGIIVCCPVGGLQPETTYSWAVGPFHESWNHVQPPPWIGNTYSSFTTGPGWPQDTIDNYAECEAHPLPEGLDGDCSGDTADMVGG